MTREQCGYRELRTWGCSDIVADSDQRVVSRRGDTEWVRVIPESVQGCDAEVAVYENDEHTDRAICPSCGQRFRIEWDAEQDETGWIDLTTIRAVRPNGADYPAEARPTAAYWQAESERLVDDPRSRP